MQVHRQGRKAGVGCISTHYTANSPPETMEKSGGFFSRCFLDDGLGLYQENGCRKIELIA